MTAPTKSAPVAYHLHADRGPSSRVVQLPAGEPSALPAGAFQEIPDGKAEQPRKRRADIGMAGSARRGAVELRNRRPMGRGSVERQAVMQGGSPSEMTSTLAAFLDTLGIAEGDDRLGADGEPRF